MSRDFQFEERERDNQQVDFHISRRTHVASLLLPAMLYHLAPHEFPGFVYDILMLGKECQGWRKLVLTMLKYRPQLDECVCMRKNNFPAKACSNENLNTTYDTV
jgi:hypothetical protein